MSLFVDIEKELSSFKLKVKFEQDNEILGLLGESGSGKSMTLKCIAGLETPTKGKIMLNGRVLYDSEQNINLSPQQRKIGYLFQNYALFPHMTIRQNIEIGLLNLKKEERGKIATRYLTKLKLNGLENMYPWQISGGQAQRVALARVLVTDPDILLLDEPFSALDYNLRNSLEVELLELISDYKRQIIFVTHDIEELYRVCDKVIVYNNGISNNKRRTEELFNSPKSEIEAKMTGCKNISKCEKISKDKVSALDWGYEYLVKESEEDINYIGIREEHIEISKNENDINRSEFIINKVIKNPFSYTVYINNSKVNSKDIRVEVKKEEFKLSVGDKINIVMPLEKIFLF